MPHSVNGSSATMSRPSSTSTTSANAFPRQAGATLQVPDMMGDPASPSRSTFSYESSPQSVQEREVSFDDTRNTRTLLGGPSDVIGQRSQTHGARQRAQYFEEQFAYKDETISSARDRVTKDAPIVVDLRTNVIIKDEYTLVTDLSHHLSQRYRRPESSIMITVNHSACLLLGGSFEPTYVLAISALPVQLQATTNKRNAALIQTFMSETIGVQAERGIIKFVPIQEECFATNGTTIRGEIERLERQQAEENGSNLKRALTKSSKRSAVSKAKSSFQLSRKGSGNVGGRNVITPPIPSPGPFDSGVAVNDKGEDTLGSLQPADSFLPRNKSAGESLTNLPPPPPIPQDSHAPRIGKRKSFISIFKR